MKPTTERLLAIVVAFSLVSTAALAGIGPGFVQEVRAEWSQECDLTDSLLGAAYNTLMGANTGCRWISGEQTDVENLTATDAYSNGLALGDSTDVYTTSTGNFVGDTRTVAYSKGKIVLLNELNNGSSVSVANNEVNKTVEDYYSRIQAELITDWNNKAVQIDYLASTNLSIAFKSDVGTSDTSYTGGIHKTDNPFTLANGSTMQVYSLPAGGYNFSIHYAIGGAAQADVKIQDPSDGSWATILYTTEYQDGTEWTYGGGTDTAVNDLLGQTQTQNQQVVDNMDLYVDDVYAQYAAGEINSTSLAVSDPSVIAAEAATDLNSTGYYSYAAIQMAAIGAGGNLNVSHTVEVYKSTGKTTLNGTLYYTAEDSPTNGWETGKTYNFTDFNGTFYFVVSKDDGNTSVVDLADYGSSFNLVEATNTKTGEAVNNTTVQRYVYDSTNASKLEAEIDRLKELRDEYENIQAGGGSTSSSSNTWLLVAAGAVGAILLLGEGNKRRRY